MFLRCCQLNGFQISFQDFAHNSDRVEWYKNRDYSDYAGAADETETSESESDNNDTNDTNGNNGNSSNVEISAHKEG